MKLSHKLITLLIATSFAVVTPVLMITYKNVSDNALLNEKEQFNNILNLEFEIINNAYLVHMNSKVDDVIALKRSLAEQTKSTDANIRSFLQNELSSPIESVFFIDSLNARSSENGVTTYVAYESQTVFPPVLKRILDSNTADIKGRTLKDMLQVKNISAYGEYATFKYKFNDYQDDVLFYFQVLDDVEFLDPAVVMSYVSLRKFKELEEHTTLSIINQMQARFDKLSLYNAAFIALINKEDKILAIKGVLEDINNVKPVLEHAQQKGYIAETIDVLGKGSYLVQSGYLKALGWSIVSAAPYSALQYETKQLVQNLLIYCLLAIGLAIVACLFTLKTIFNPLRSLMQKVNVLRSIQLSHTEELKEFSNSLPSYRNDEIGLLANNFKLLSNELADKLSSLFETTRIKERMQGELHAAREIQLDILNSQSNSPNNEAMSTAFFLEAAKEVGGDLYDYILLKNGKYALIIGDVSGKGVPAALFMSMTVTLIRYALNTNEDLKEAVMNVNNMLASHNDANMFVTLLVLIYDPITSEIEYLNGGHCQPLVVNRETKEVRMLEGLSGPMVGVFEMVEYSSYFDKLGENETLVAFSDGVTEAMNEENVLYSDERLVEFLSQNAHCNTQDMINNIFTSILDFRGEAEASDDITIFSLSHPFEIADKIV